MNFIFKKVGLFLVPRSNKNNHVQTYRTTIMRISFKHETRFGFGRWRYRIENATFKTKKASFDEFETHCKISLGGCCSQCPHLSGIACTSSWCKNRLELSPLRVTNRDAVMQCNSPKKISTIMGKRRD